MFLNHLYVTLTPESLACYRQLVALHHLTLDNDPKLTIMISQDPLSPKPEQFYQTACTEVQLYYNSAAGSSSLEASLHCTMIEDRFVDLVEKDNVLPAFGLHYFPHSTLVRHFPPITRRNRNRLNQFALAMVMHPFEWGNEQVVVEEFFAEPSLEYNMLWQAATLDT
jgi:hypothetical protein